MTRGGGSDDGPRIPEIAATAVTALEPGLRVGGYAIVSLLGAGGMGEVYLAEDTRLRRKVAIKVVRPGAHPSAGLLAEAQAMAKLSHRNVVTVYEAGELGDEVFIAMEYVDGPTLRHWLAAAARPWRATLAAFVAAGRGLAAAHAAGIVHRDFKPDNVLVDAGGRPCVTDFGLAELPDGARAGTPAYMAPEQHRGDAADARADQFAFCVALHEALYGERPFAGASAAEVRSSVLGGAPRPPPRGSRVPSWLRAAVARGLSREPAARFPTMDALLAVIDRDPAARRRRAALVVALTATSALGVAGLLRRPAPPPACDGAAGRVARVWNPAVATALRGAFLASGRGYAADTATRVVAALDRYAGDWSAMHREACEASAVRHEQSAALLDLRMACLDRRLGGLGALAVELARRPDPRVLDRAVQAAAELDDLGRCADAAALAAAMPPPEDPAVRARVAALRPRLDRAVALHRSGVARDALAVARALVAEVNAIPDDATQAEALAVAAGLARIADDGAYAESLARAALLPAARAHDDRMLAGLWADLIYTVGTHEGRGGDALAMAAAAETAVARAGDPPREHAKLLAALGKTYRLAGRPAEAEIAFRHSVALFEKAGDRVGRINALVSLGDALRASNRRAEAVLVLTEARDAAVALYGPDFIVVAAARHSLANVLQQLGRLGEALASEQGALGICERALGADHSNCAASHATLGNIYRHLGQHDDALASYQRALVIKEKRLGPDHPDTLSSVENLAEVALDRGRLAEARAYEARALAGRERALGPAHAAVAESLCTRGGIALAAGELGAARGDATRALTIAEASSGADSTDAADVRALLAALAAAEGRHGAALAEAQRVVAIREKLLGADHADVAAALAGSGAALLALGRPAEAAAALGRAVAIREHGEGDPHDLAGARFLLARSLRDDPARARALAADARRELAAEGERGRVELASVDAWLRDR